MSVRTRTITALGAAAVIAASAAPVASASAHSVAAKPSPTTTTHPTVKATSKPAAKPTASKASKPATKPTSTKPGARKATTPTRRGSTAPRPASVTAAKYTNWAGYQVSVKDPQAIHASWIVPKATWPGRDGYSAMWVGLGGGNATQGELVQAGTESDSVCIAATRGHCTKWRTSYYPWVETYPSRAQERITNLEIKPGDAVEVTVRYAPREGRSFFTLCNWRSNDCVATDRKSAAPKGVAEAVLERTSGANGQPRALANVGTPRFSGVYVKGSPGTRNLQGWPSARVTMATGAALATPGTIDHCGDAFGVTFHRPA